MKRRIDLRTRVMFSYYPQDGDDDMWSWYMPHVPDVGDVVVHAVPWLGDERNGPLSRYRVESRQWVFADSEPYVRVVLAADTPVGAS